MATVDSGILIVGSTGAFGSKIAELLARRPSADLVLSGRTATALDAQAKALSDASGTSVRFAVLDAARTSPQDLAPLGVGIVINASGPFQDAAYGLPRAAIAAGCHYIDLADARAFVTGIRQLDGEARTAGVLAVSGASSVPGLSSAVVSNLRETFAGVFEIDIAISPGNSFDPGVATVRSVLGGIGQPMRVLVDGAWQTVYGWQGLKRGDFGAAGRRFLGYVDVPDLDLLPAHVAGLRTVRFQAGLEVPAFHLGLWAASWLVRGGLAPSLAGLAPGLLSIKRRLGFLGSDRGGMTVTLRGIGRDGRPKSSRWLLVAGSGHGPYVPALAAVALARRLVSGAESRRGALPCHALVSLEDILAEARALDITTEINEEPLPP
jgi:hypothetical protein